MRAQTTTPRRLLGLLGAVATLVVPLGLVGATEVALAAAPSEVASGDLGEKPPWISLDTGDEHTCGVRENGSLWCWGHRFDGRLGQPWPTDRIAPSRVDEATDWASVELGSKHSCATKTDGSLWCFGINLFGQLGDGTQISRSTPTRVSPEVTNWAQVSGGAKHSCATRTDSTLWCWGRNEMGAVGSGTHEVFVLEPAQVAGPAGWSQVSANGTNARRQRRSHTCAVKTDATLWCWGSNRDGELGLGEASDDPVRTPRQVAPERDWATVTAGERTTCAIATDGSLWCWGLGRTGALGLGTTESQAAPAQVGTSKTWSTVGAGVEHTCATQVDGTAWCWGRNEDGQLGDGTRRGRRVPVRVVGDEAWSSVEAGWAHTCGRTAEGLARCWGSDDNGQLGTGRAKDAPTPRAVTDQSGPWTAEWSATDGSCGTTAAGHLSCWSVSYVVNRVMFAGFVSGKAWVGATGSSAHTCAIDPDQALWCAGLNASGQLGDGSHNSRADLKPVSGGGSWAQVSAGDRYTCGVQTDGSLWCWGSGLYGRLGLGDNQERRVPTRVGTGAWLSVSAGYGSTCAIASDGSLWCWGDNDDGQLGDGTTIDRGVPTLVGSGPWASVAMNDVGGADGQHTCATRAGGTAWCWGRGTFGQLGDGHSASSLTPVRVAGDGAYVTVTTGDSFSCGVQDDGTGWCWGSYALGDGTVGPSPVPVAVSGGYSFASVSALEYGVCGVTIDQRLLCWGDVRLEGTPSTVPVEAHTVRNL